MRIMLHDNHEKQLLKLSNSAGLSPSQYIKKVIAFNYNNLDCTIDAQGGISGREQKEKEL